VSLVEPGYSLGSDVEALAWSEKDYSESGASSTGANDLLHLSLPRDYRSANKSGTSGDEGVSQYQFAAS
jgi:hypothetical protein